MQEWLGTELPEWLLHAPRVCADPRAAARGLREAIEAQADAAEAAGALSMAAVRGIAETGLWGILLPEEFGGRPADAATLVDVIEELSYADGSAGWVYMAALYAIGISSVMLGPDAVQAMYRGDQGWIVAGQISTLGEAVRVPGGWRVRGTFHFGSGTLQASWMLGAFAVQEGGAPALDAAGKPKIIWAYAPRRNIRFRGNWDVLGLRATSSVDFEFIEQFVADDFVLSAASRRTRGGPIFDVGVSLGHVAFSLGVARRALDEIRALALRKRRFMRTTLIDQPVFQRDFGTAAASLQAAQAGVRAAFIAWERDATGGRASLEVRAQARLAACWATDICARVGEFAYRAAGSDGLRNQDGHNRLQRCFRDLYASTQHRQIDNNVLLEASTALLGIAPAGLEM